MADRADGFEGAAPSSDRVIGRPQIGVLGAVAVDVDNPPLDRPGVGAAGGVGYAAMAVLGGELEPGIGLVLDLIRFADHLPGARLVITGEGSLDEQTLSGKAPAGVAAAALAAGVQVVTVSGRLALTDDQLRAAGIARAYALTDIEPDVQRCLADAGPLLERLVGQLARDWLAEPDPGSAPEVPTELEVDR